jgi:hypothetical protein
MATSHLPDREWKSRLKASGACEMYVEESREVEGSIGVLKDTLKAPLWCASKQKETPRIPISRDKRAAFS